MTPSHQFWITLCALLLVASIGRADEPAARPVNVSPGNPVGALISERCPTFSWAGLESAESYELVVYGVPQGLTQAKPEDLKKRIQVSLPGAAHAWTPSLERCFEPGGHYAWALRAVTAEGLSEWSEVSLFEVSAAPSVAEVEQAMVVLRRYLRRGREEGPEAEEAPLPDARNPRSVPASGQAMRRLGEGLRALSSGTVGAGPLSKTVTTPAAAAPTLGTASLTVDQQIHLGSESHLFKEGNLLLWEDGNNTALGHLALSSNTSGTHNTAHGAFALSRNTDGLYNTAHGANALRFNSFGDSRNTAVGFRALYRLGYPGNSGGSDNIALGSHAGSDLFIGDNNIFLGNPGPDDLAESNRIRIGNSSHTDTYIAGQVALGTDDNPANQLVVKESINGNGAQTTNHVVLFENPSTGTSPDVLALKVGATNPSGTVNFITFFDASGGIGAIEGNGGGVTLNASSADFAEYLPKLDPAEALRAGDVVGLFGGRLSRATDGAERVLVVTTHPIVVGGDPGPSRAAAYERVAFLGQAPVRVRGPVREGDYVVASGRQDGTAVAVAEEDLDWDQAPLLVGRALESSSERGESTVRTLVGLPQTATFASWAGDLASEVRKLQIQVDSLRLSCLPSREGG